MGRFNSRRRESGSLSMSAVRKALRRLAREQTRRRLTATEKVRIMERMIAEIDVKAKEAGFSQAPDEEQDER